MHSEWPSGTVTFANFWKTNKDERWRSRIYFSPVSGRLWVRAGVRRRVGIGVRRWIRSTPVSWSHKEVKCFHA